jgi:hypothetical protein
MRLAIAVAIAVGSLGASAGASAEVIDPNDKVPLAPPSAFSAAPYGARYYPGIGFRYVLPPSERVYGYYAGPRVYGYRARYRACARERFWWFDRDARCGYARGRW